MLTLMTKNPRKRAELSSCVCKEQVSATDPRRNYFNQQLVSLCFSEDNIFHAESSHAVFGTVADDSTDVHFSAPTVARRALSILGTATLPLADCPQWRD